MSSLSNAYKNLHKQLLINIKQSTKKQAAEDIKKRIALFTYQRINFLRDQTPESNSKVIEINKKIDQLQKQNEDPDVAIEPTLLNGVTLKEDNERNAIHINDIANFLSYQRTYQELIERYNPGLTMTQEDKIRKTANKVGFELPKDN
ncbi:hypothetical protein WICMUC_004886 [Wickerhamomyces mucosus]|uniref:ATP synthase assembly factor FMC1, mitochondrial n=1 Tax=Wickerhamomyces mucosus TaxID=1378264 RepID=A0A9P8PFI3_9ASCO|nr:hypothetical protein WICMUC_004886 [Wickerhamomyces mucosus]